jgi:hypothetical protein
VGVGVGVGVDVGVGVGATLYLDGYVQLHVGVVHGTCQATVYWTGCGR